MKVIGSILFLWGIIQGFIASNQDPTNKTEIIILTDNIGGLFGLDIISSIIGITGLIKQNYTLDWGWRISTILLMIAQLLYLSQNYTSLQSNDFTFVSCLMVTSFCVRLIAFLFTCGLGYKFRGNIFSLLHNLILNIEKHDLEEQIFLYH